MFNKRRLAVLFFTGIFAAPANAQEKLCVLLQDTLVQGASSTAKEAYFHQACQQTYDEFDRSWKASASGQYKLVGGGGSYSRQNYRKWKQSKCSSQGKSEHRSRSFYLSSKFVSDNARKAYIACLKEKTKERLICLSKANSRDIDFLIIWNEPSTTGRVALVSLRGGSGNVPTIGATVRRGTATYTVRPNNKNTPVRLTLNIDYGNATASCVASARLETPKPVIKKKPTISIHKADYGDILRCADALDSTHLSNLRARCNGESECIIDDISDATILGYDPNRRCARRNAKRPYELKVHYKCSGNNHQFINRCAQGKKLTLRCTAEGTQCN